MIEMKTELNGYSLWFDGVADVGSDDYKAVSLMLQGVPTEKIVCRSKDAKTFNQKSESSMLTKKDSCTIPPVVWNISGSDDYVSIKKKLLSEVEAKYPSDQYRNRLTKELAIFESSEDGMRFCECIQYVLDMFAKDGVVWGVGRGSSCASLVLFLMGLHCIDPVKWDLPMEEFFGNQVA